MRKIAGRGRSTWQGWLGLFDSSIALINQCGHQRPSLPQPVACSGDCCKLRLSQNLQHRHSSNDVKVVLGRGKLLVGGRVVLVRIAVACSTVQWPGLINSIVDGQHCCSRLHAAVTAASCNWYARQAASPHTGVREWDMGLCASKVVGGGGMSMGRVI